MQKSLKEELLEVARKAVLENPQSDFNKVKQIAYNTANFGLLSMPVPFEMSDMCIQLLTESGMKITNYSVKPYICNCDIGGCLKCGTKIVHGTISWG